MRVVAKMLDYLFPRRAEAEQKTREVTEGLEEIMQAIKKDREKEHGLRMRAMWDDEPEPKSE